MDEESLPDNPFPVEGTKLRMFQYEDLDPDSPDLLQKMRLVETQGRENRIALERLHLLENQLNQCFYREGVNYKENCKDIRLYCV